MSNDSSINFVRQQGFKESAAAECAGRFPALMFQPRLIGLIVAIGLVLQSAYLFLALSAVLWWNAILPTFSLFDAVYNALIARPRGFPLLTPAPAPRRFAQGMAATFMFVIGLSLLSGWHTLAWISEGLLVIALLSLIFGRFCLGSYLFHIFTGNRAFADRTLPWRKAD